MDWDVGPGRTNRNPYVNLIPLHNRDGPFARPDFLM